MEQIINYILSMGAAVFLPIIMIILGLIIKMKPRKAIIAGITLGIAFVSMNVILGFMFSTISPVAQTFVDKTGLQLTAVDVGWSPMSAIAWAWPYALMMFPLQIAINLIMLFTKQTDVLNVDLWNVWGKIFTATMVAALSGSIILGFVAAAIQVVLELIVGSVSQKRIENITKIPGVTCTHYMILECIIMNPVNKLLDLIPGINKIDIDSDKLKNKIGIFGENSVMGLIVGSMLALLAGYSIKDTLNIGISVGAALVLFPMVAKLFMQALAPIADAAGQFMKSKFKDRQIYIGLDWPFMAGRSELWVVAILIVPIELILAFLLANMGFSNVLPLAGIINVIVAVPALIVTGGNIIRMLILSVIFTPVYLMVSSAFAGAVTSLAKAVGTIDIPLGQTITYFGVESPEFRWAIAKAFSMDIWGISALTIFAILLFFYIKAMRKSNETL